VRYACAVGLVYFDTDTFRAVGAAFRDSVLDNRLRRRIVLSPITLLEAMSQLVVKDRQTVLAQIQAMHNWLPSNAAARYPMPNCVIAEIGFDGWPSLFPFWFVLATPM